VGAYALHLRDIQTRDLGEGGEPVSGERPIVAGPILGVDHWRARRSRDRPRVSGVGSLLGIRARTSGHGDNRSANGYCEYGSANWHRTSSVRWGVGHPSCILDADARGTSTRRPGLHGLAFTLEVGFHDLLELAANPSANVQETARKSVEPVPARGYQIDPGSAIQCRCIVDRRELQGGFEVMIRIDLFPHDQRVAGWRRDNHHLVQCESRAEMWNSVE